MTAADERTHEPQAAPGPVPIQGEVVVHGSARVHNEAADFGAYFTMVLAGTENPQPLLPYDVNRARAYVTCTGTGPVYVGSVAGVTALKAGAATGQAPAFILATGITLIVTHKQAVYISPDGTHAATVSVAVERWES